MRESRRKRRAPKSRRLICFVPFMRSARSPRKRMNKQNKKRLCAAIPTMDAMQFVGASTNCAQIIERNPALTHVVLAGKFRPRVEIAQRIAGFIHRSGRSTFRPASSTWRCHRIVGTRSELFRSVTRIQTSTPTGGTHCHLCR